MDLHSAIKTVSHAMSSDAARRNLNQILVAKNGDVCATDGYRLAIARTDHTGADLHIVRPIAEVLRRLPTRAWCVDEDGIHLKGLGTWAPVCDPPRFPPYRQVVPGYASATGETRTRKAWLESFGEPAGSNNAVAVCGTWANIDYVKDALKACGGTKDDVTIVVGDPLDPIVFRSASGDVMCIVMPCRM